MWKNFFGKNRCEITISKGGQKHRANVLTESGVVIELQNPPISKDVIRKREEFYGDKMFWIVNGEPFKETCKFLTERINPYAISRNSKLKKNAILNKGMVEVPMINWARSIKNWKVAQRDIFIDFGEDKLFWVLESMGTKKQLENLSKNKRFLRNMVETTNIILKK